MTTTSIRDYLDQSGISDRRAGGLKWGESTVITLAGGDLVGGKLKMPERRFALEALSKPLGSDERQQLEHQFFTTLDNIVQLSKEAGKIFDKPNGDRVPLSCTVKVANDYVVKLNAGYGSGEEYITAVIGDTTYRLSRTESTIGSLVSNDGKSTVALSFKDESPLTRGIKEILPEFAKLVEIESLTGEKLRNALPEVSSRIQTNLQSFCGDLTEIMNRKDLKAKYAEETGKDPSEIEDVSTKSFFPRSVEVNEVQADNDIGQKVRIKFDLNEDGEIESMAILNEPLF